MNITCSHNRLRSALEVGERIVSRHLTLPILNNVLLHASANKLSVSATNLEMGVVATLPCKVKKEGTVTVPAKVLYGVIANLTTDTVDLELKQKTSLNIKAGSYSGTVRGERPDDFPIIPEIKEATLFKAEGGELADALGRVVPFTSVSETRPELTGVLFDVKEKDPDVSLVAADGFRLARQRISRDKKGEQKPRAFIVPQRTIAEVVRIGKEGGQVEVVFGKSQAEFQFPHYRLVSRLIEGSYPDYTTLIPSSFETEVTVERDDLIKQLRLVSLLSSRINDVHLNVDDDSLTLKTHDPDLGESTVSLKAAVEGGGMEISFNWRYLLEGLQHVQDRKAHIRFVSSEKAALIQSPSGSSYIYVVMPLRV